MKEIVYKVNIIQVVKLLVIGLLPLLVGMLMLTKGNGFFMYFGFLVSASAFYLVFSLIRNATFDLDVLTLNKDGFNDNSTATSVGFIPWKAVDDIYVIKGITKFAKPVISVKIAGEYLDELDIVIKKDSKFNKKFNKKYNNSYEYGEVNISLQLLKETHMEVVEEMINYLKEFNNLLD